MVNADQLMRLILDSNYNPKLVSGLSELYIKLLPDNIAKGVRYVIKHSVAHADAADFSEILQKIRKEGRKVYSALGQASNANVYNYIVVMTKPKGWESYKPFSNDDISGIYYFFAGDESDFIDSEDKNPGAQYLGAPEEVPIEDFYDDNVEENADAIYLRLVVILDCIINNIKDEMGSVRVGDTL